MSQGRRKPLVYALVTLGLSILGSSLVPAQEIIRFTYDVPGDSKPVVVHADAMATWTEDNERIILLKGKVLVEHGVVQAHMDEAVIWLDLEHQRRTGIQRLEVYAQGNVILENGPETRKGAQALFGLITRGEMHIDRQSFTDAGFYDRSRLREGDEVPGPAVIDDRLGTIVINPGATARVATHGTLRIEV